MTHVFDRASALSALGPGRFAGELSEDFWVQSGPNGGYMAAIALRAMSALVPVAERPARSLHARYLAAPKAGPFEAQAEVVRAGRSMTFAQVCMTQEGRPFLLANACFSAGFSEIAFQDCAPPQMLELAQAVPVPKRIPLNHRYELLRALGEGERSGSRARSGGYIRFAEPRDLDALALAALWDAWPPAVFARAFEQRFRGAVPTVEVSVYFRRRLPLPSVGPSDFVRIVVESTMADEGIVEESADLWTGGGLLLAQSRQLALLM